MDILGLKSRRATRKRNSLKAFDQRKWIRGFTISAILVWVFYAYIVKFFKIVVNISIKKRKNSLFWEIFWAFWPTEKI